ncbi:hypothetical protein Droror1_Dr00025714 [Drosera rotundifolia]
MPGRDLQAEEPLAGESSSRWGATSPGRELFTPRRDLHAGERALHREEHLRGHQPPSRRGGERSSRRGDIFTLGSHWLGRALHAGEHHAGESSSRWGATSSWREHFAGLRALHAGEHHAGERSSHQGELFMPGRAPPGFCPRQNLK